MKDSEIIELFWTRDERAIAETDKKYGGLCRSIAQNLLDTPEDAEECVSDAFLAAWEQIPPQRPVNFRAWLGKLVRNISVNRWHSGHARKRYGGPRALLSELDECIPSPDNVEKIVDGLELTELLESWLQSLSKDDRALFIRRYWYGETLSELSKLWGTTPEKLAQRMFRLRRKLRSRLEKEGISI